MDKVYADLIQKGLRMLDDVPAALRPAVVRELESRHWFADAESPKH